MAKKNTNGLKKQLYDIIVDFADRNKITHQGKLFKNTLYIGSEDVHKAQFKLIWTSNNHYVVYLVLKSKNGRNSQALAALWNITDVILFMEALLNLSIIYAQKSNPN